MRRAALYARYSSDRQNERSIADQLTLAREIATRAGFAIAAEFSDAAVSGASTLNRPGWQQLMRRAAAGEFDVVVIETTSRAFRDEADYHAARKRLDFLEIELRTSTGTVSRIEGTIRAMQDANYLEQLAVHVHRGLAGRARAGSNVSSPPYGYRAMPGQPGQLQIIEHQAAIVRQIFEAYAGGASPRAIARVLNRDNIAGPRGGLWNASTINGSRARANGIIQNRCYIGQIVWNRQRFKKDPDRGTRIARVNDQRDWITAPAPALRIVTDDLWQRVQLRLAERGQHQERHKPARPVHLLSGLVKCASCGSSYVAVGADRLGCSRRKETGSCTQTQRIRRSTLEAQILAAVQQQLAAPDLVAAYVREYHRLAAAQSGAAGRQRAQLERQLSSVKADSQALLTAFLQTRQSAAVADRLAQLDAERSQLEARLAALAAPPVRLHPQAAETYRRRVEDLAGALRRLAAHDQAAGSDHHGQAIAILRELVDRIEVQTGAGAGVRLIIHGRAAALFDHVEGAAAVDPLKRVLVAGARYQHALQLPTWQIAIPYRP